MKGFPQLVKNIPNEIDVTAWQVQSIIPLAFETLQQRQHLALSPTNDSHCYISLWGVCA
jgi:hypothetical protein